MKNIIISGTPGCGKTSVAEEISNIIDAKVISLNELAISDKFSFEYDEDRKTYIVDFEIFLPYVLEKIEEIKQEDTTYLIIESHFSDIIPEKFIDYAFILRCDPDELFKRLESKDYDLRKITENIRPRSRWPSELLTRQCEAGRLKCELEVIDDLAHLLGLFLYLCPELAWDRKARAAPV